MKNILVLCTGNSCRSQIAEGYLKHFAKEKARIYSAGIETHGLNPQAVETMMEDGIDISQHTSNHIDEYANIVFDLIITVCDNAKENCPFFPGNAMKIHQNFPDPSKFIGKDEDKKSEFRRIREMIKSFSEEVIATKL